VVVNLADRVGARGRTFLTVSTVTTVAARTGGTVRTVNSTESGTSMAISLELRVGNELMNFASNR
jgi:hypothetical protein